MYFYFLWSVIKNDEKLLMKWGYFTPVLRISGKLEKVYAITLLKRSGVDVQWKLILLQLSSTRNNEKQIQRRKGTVKIVNNYKEKEISSSNN